MSLSPAEEPSPWVSRFDEGSLASEAARCLRRIGDLGQAQQQAERIIALRPGDRTKIKARTTTLTTRMDAEAESRPQRPPIHPRMDGKIRAGAP